MKKLNKMILKADNLCREFVQQRDNFKCRKCSNKHNLEWSHVFTRRCKNIRHYGDNSFLLCSVCHKYFDNNKQKYYKWVINEIGITRWNTLMQLRSNTEPITETFMNDVICEYKTLLGHPTKQYMPRNKIKDIKKQKNYYSLVGIRCGSLSLSQAAKLKGTTTAILYHYIDRLTIIHKPLRIKYDTKLIQLRIRRKS